MIKNEPNSFGERTAGARNRRKRKPLTTVYVALLGSPTAVWFCGKSDHTPESKPRVPEIHASISHTSRTASRRWRKTRRMMCGQRSADSKIRAKMSSRYLRYHGNAMLTRIELARYEKGLRKMNPFQTIMNTFRVLTNRMRLRECLLIVSSTFLGGS
jgi:hypothetical protein